MRRIVLTLGLLAGLGGLGTAQAGHDDGRAVLGGALGGGIGAWVGQELDGRGGAILGSALGAGLGTAAVTDGHRHGRTVRHYPERRRYHGGPPAHAPAHGYHRYKGKTRQYGNHRSWRDSGRRWHKPQHRSYHRPHHRRHYRHW